LMVSSCATLSMIFPPAPNFFVGSRTGKCISRPWVIYVIRLGVLRAMRIVRTHAEPVW
jgi:hypothetical protein